ncbi:MAG TPA: hypothetical protein VMY41_02475 [Thermohalobaculum sp.]|nr:hypothetical protein [Thermohalobaculum sp.]
MTHETKILRLGIDGLWSPMDFARLLHLVVRSYRLEQLVVASRTGGPNFFDRRLDAVVLKYIAAFDWIAAPLMSEKFNDSYAKSEEFVRDFGVADLRVHKINYHSAGQIEFSGVGSIIDKMFETFHEVLLLKSASLVGANDSQGKFSDIDFMYATGMKEKANLMREMGYSDAELHAIISPSIEDLHFISNAMTQGKIVAVEIASVAR